MLIACEASQKAKKITDRNSAAQQAEHSVTNLGCIFTAFLFEVVELHHLGHDEALLKVSVDLSCSLWSL